jgi:ketosteroid isomerase-like protein
MSKNADILLQGTHLLENEDWDAFSRIWHPDCRITGPEGWPEPGPFEGRDAVIGQFKRLVSDFEETRFAEVEVVAERKDWVVLSFRWDVRGAGSGVAIASKMAGAYRLQDGRTIEAHFRWTPKDALEAAGLSSSSAAE